MSKRLQVVMDDEDLRRIQRVARQHRMSVAEWVRRTLFSACDREPVGDARKKIQVVRAAARNAYPTADIDQMLAEIERGYTPDDAR